MTLQIKPSIFFCLDNLTLQKKVLDTGRTQSVVCTVISMLICIKAYAEKKQKHKLTCASTAVPEM